LERNRLIGIIFFVGLFIVIVGFSGTAQTNDKNVSMVLMLGNLSIHKGLPVMVYCDEQSIIRKKNTKYYTVSWYNHGSKSKYHQHPLCEPVRPNKKYESLLINNNVCVQFSARNSIGRCNVR
jgi:hypothetical protein